jgi:hypothetical protein
VLYPDINDGIEGVAFVTACVESARRGGNWVSLDRYLR